MRCWYRARSCTRIGAGPFIGGPSAVHRSIAARSSRVVPASAAASPAGPCGIGWFGPNVDPDRGAAAGDAAVADGEDGLGHWVGGRYGRRMLDASVGKVVKREHFDRAEEFLGRRGGPAVFLGRWAAAFRVMVPGLAGMSRMRYRTFLLYNVAGGAAWA